MPTRQQFKELAEVRLNEAELLHKHNFNEGAYYVAGYAAELALKAAICRCLNIEVFDERSVTNRISEPFRVHKLDHLLVFAGLATQLNDDAATDTKLHGSWSTVSGWKEDRRYAPIGSCSAQTTRKYLNAVILFMSWIRKHW